MKRNFGYLQEELGKELQAALEEPNPITRYSECIRAAQSAIRRMKEMVAGEGFESRADEIHHFKHEAPELYSQLFYYQKLKEIETDRPLSNPKDFRSLLLRSKEEADMYFRKAGNLPRYYSAQDTHLDDHLFVRRSEGQWLGDPIGAFIPSEMTPGTHVFAMIKANDRLRQWIQEEMDLLNGVQRSHRLRWTGTRIDLITLLSALHLAGVFNNGKITKKEIMLWAEEEWGVKVGQYDSAMNDKASVKNPTAFLKRLLDIMVQKFDKLIG